MAGDIKVKRALVSVSDKTGLEELGAGLQDLGIEIISTGGTLRALKDAGVQAISVSGFTGSPEILGGRVKTLHPKVHGGILYLRGDAGHEEDLAQFECRGIDLVIVNLYPFEQTVAKPDATDPEIIENIDIGGPTMIRAAAKNHQFVTVVTSPDDYTELLKQLKDSDGETTYEFRRKCARKAFALTCRYDTAIADYFAAENKGTDDAETEDELPARVHLNFSFAQGLRYGENPHQNAAVYEHEGFPPGPTLLRAKVLSGKELSFNNYGDLDATLDMILDFDRPFACVVKHANPCGAALGQTIAEAYEQALATDPLSAFGSIIGVNREVDMDCAKLLHETQFVECIVAPSFTDEAFKLLKKKKARRLLVLPEIEQGIKKGELTYKVIRGGVLVQTADDVDIAKEDLKIASKREPTPEEMKSLMFGWRLVKHVKSNAIVLTRGEAAVGIGMGQTSRVDSAIMAVKRAGDRAKGACVASDAFFPMPDGALVGLDAGATAIIQPGGSKGDEAVLEAVDKANGAMVYTGMRHFKH